MGLGLKPWIGRASYRLNCLAAKVFEQRRYPLVITYHRIGRREQLWPDLIEIAEANLDQFERQMEWLVRYTEPVSMAEYREIVSGTRPSPSRAVLVTFDDGYREDLLRTVPVLERTGIRPTVFLPTAFVGTDVRFWWDRIGTCVQTAVLPRLRLAYPERVDLPLQTPAERDVAMRRLIELAKTLSRDGREEMLVALETSLELPSTATLDRRRVLDWDEVRELRRVFDYGAHTHTHARLSTLAADELRDELGRCKQIVERELGEPCRSIAIPYGGESDYTDEAVRVAGEVGFELVFSMHDSLRPPKPFNGALLVDRVTLDPRLDVPGLAAKLTWPQLFVPDWTGRARRGLGRLWPGL
ncbi:MAG: polysaccharide deacetylase family protein [Deltaproteobacteria bacterium]|nr:polysaccharide deacetylase family protein [Deltaproteobacteria bacterium]